jgi:ectoine hydroxylase-related dioxygenase (phytanoyl-CoA dioxygenase family)
LKKLTEAQREQYLTHGYIVVRNVLSPEQLERYKARAREFALGNLPPGSQRMVVQDVRVAKGLVQPDDPEKGIWKYLNPDRYDPLFAAYSSQPGLLDVVEDLLGPDIKAFLVMFIYKPPALDFVHPYHQDAYYFYFSPHDAVLGTWLALDPTGADNGTLSVIRGSHKWDLLPHVGPKGDAVNYGVFGVEGYDGHPNEQVLELEPGDAVFFHSRLLHKTGSNTSGRPRRVITVHYANAHCKPTGGEHHQAIKFQLVRGQSFEGCI